MPKQRHFASAYAAVILYYGEPAYLVQPVRAKSRRIWQTRPLMVTRSIMFLFLTLSLASSRYFGWLLTLTDCQDRTALLKAIDYRNLAAVRTLIKAGANVNLRAKADYYSTPLQAAVSKGCMNMAQYLLENGADVNAPPHDIDGATALQFAALEGYTGTAVLLLDKGADVNAPPARLDGRTALERAAKHGRKDMVQLLLTQIIGAGNEQTELH